MKMRTLEGNEIDLNDNLVKKYKMSLIGQLFAPGEEGYQESRTVWNGMINRNPGLVAKCSGIGDVITSVRFAVENNLLLAVKGGGHNIAGLALADGALVLDMSLMAGIWVDVENKIAHTQAGCLLGDVDRETQAYGLAAILGFVSLTGTVGLTLGGGFGYLTRRWGWTTDNVTAIELVTAEGKLVRASEDENPELFWGLRGGGGNFGVVTGIDYRLYPVGPEVIGGVVAWTADRAPEVLDLYRDLAMKAPPELTLVTMVRPAPPAPWLPPEIHGKMIAAILACYTGPLEEGEKLLAPVKQFGKPVGDILIRRPYAQLQSMLDGTQPKGRRYYWKSEYLPGVGPEICEKVIEHAGKIRSPHSAVILFQLEGALSQFDNNHSAVGNRDAKFVLNIAGSWDKAEDDAINIQWAREAWKDMKSFSTGGNYINFLTEDEGQERVNAALGENLKRLSSIKTKWDPGNIFRTNRNIIPT